MVFSAWKIIPIVHHSFCAIEPNALWNYSHDKEKAFVPVACFRGFIIGVL